MRRRTLPAALLAIAGTLLVPVAASATETTYTFTRPITVGGYEVLQAATPAAHPSVHGSITRMETDIVDDAGTPVPISRLMLHHIVFVNGAQPDATCGSFLGFDNLRSLPARERFYAAGEERSKLVLPPGYGYPTNNEPWGMVYMVMNHRSAVDHANIQYKVTVDDDPSLQPVRPYWMDVHNCSADAQYTVPGTGRPGSVDVRTSDVTMQESGRIVAGGGHVHGGAHGLTLSEPDCGDREIARFDPTWATADHPFYNVRPVLHEPGPLNMSAFTTPTGIPVRAGERVRINSIYDNSAPHMRVMGISIFYLAPDPTVGSSCGPLPGDVTTLGASQPGRPGPIPVTVPLTGLDRTGQAVTIKAPPGKLKRAGKKSLIHVGDRFFSRRNLKIKRGRSLRWRFSGADLHNLTLANGPVGIASPNLDRSRDFRVRFTRAGTYRFFCSLHPVQMSERVVVKKRLKKKRKHGGKQRKRARP